MKLNTVYHHHHHLTAAAIIPKKLNIGAGGHIPTILESILKQEDHPRGSIKLKNSNFKFNNCRGQHFGIQQEKYINCYYIFSELTNYL